jgi:hypothetical protein
MRTLARAFGVAVACGAMMASPREVAASDFSIEGEVMRGNPAFVIPIVLDVGFSAYDLMTVINDTRGNQGLAIAETIVALPQFLFAGLVTAANARYSSALGPGVFALWMGALATHGTVVIVMGPPDEASQPGDDPSTPQPRTDHPRIGIAPTMLGDGTRAALVPGVVAVGRF